MTVFESRLGRFTLHPAGHIAAWHNPDGSVVTDTAAGFCSGNDPALGGIGAVAWHHYRQNGQPDFWNRSWEINPSRTGLFGATRTRDLGAGVVETDYDDHEGAVARTRHYCETTTTGALRLTIVVEQRAAGVPAFVKEPKIVVGFRQPFTAAYCLDTHGGVLGRYDLTKIHDPAVKTFQLRSPVRNAVHLEPGGITVRARTGIGRWMPSKRGLDGWAQASETRPRLDAGDMAQYCTDGGQLRRYWEIVKRGDDQVALLLHGWEGGTGLPDCLGCARAYGPPGESWANVITVTRGRA